MQLRAGITTTQRPRAQPQMPILKGPPSAPVQQPECYQAVRCPFLGVSAHTTNHLTMPPHNHPFPHTLKQQDLLARLSSSLSAVEQYAVRFLESLRHVDVEAAAAAAVEDIKQEEWELDAIEKRQEQQVC